MNEEMVALDANETQDLVTLLEGKNVNGYKWVYKVKHNAIDSISRYKANAQTYGLDYEEMFNPVAKMVHFVP